MNFFVFFCHLFFGIAVEKGNQQLYFDLYSEKYQKMDKSIFFYNCYFDKDCEIFENALKQYADIDDVYIEKVTNQSITSYFTLIYDENISISISKVKNTDEITSVLDFYFTDKRKSITSFNFSATRYIKIIGPKNSFYELKNMVMDAADDFGFIDIVLAEEDYGYKFYNPFEKLFHSFDGSFYSFVETLQKQLTPYDFRQMVNSRSISLIIMNPDPPLDVRESLYEIKTIFPYLSVVIPDKEAIQDINYIINSSSFDFVLLHASLGIYSGVTLDELEKLNISVKSHKKSVDDKNHNSDIDDNMYDSRFANYNEVYDSQYIDEFSQEYYEKDSDYDYEYGDSNEGDQKINKYSNVYDYYYRNYFSMWGKARKYYYGLYSSKSSSINRYPYSTKIEFDNDGNPRNSTIHINDLNTPDIAFNGGPGKKKRNVISKEIKTKLRKQRKLYPMSSFAHRITLWLTKQNITANWMKISTNTLDLLSDDQYSMMYKHLKQKKKIRIINTESYSSFLNGDHDCAILFIDLSEKSHFMVDKFLEAAELSIHSPFCKNLEFAIVNADYNYLEYTKNEILPLTFKSALPFVAVSPKEWFDFIPFITDSPESIGNLINRYIDRQRFGSPDEILSSYSANQTDVEKFMMETLKNNINNNSSDALFYWNFEFYRSFNE